MWFVTALATNFTRIGTVGDWYPTLLESEEYVLVILCEILEVANVCTIVQTKKSSNAHNSALPVRKNLQNKYSRNIVYGGHICNVLLPPAESREILFWPCLSVRSSVRRSVCLSGQFCSSAAIALKVFRILNQILEISNMFIED